MLAQCVTAGVLFGAGDVIAQQAIEKRGWAKHDVRSHCISLDDILRLLSLDGLYFYRNVLHLQLPVPVYIDCAHSKAYLLRRCSLRVYYDEVVPRPRKATVRKSNEGCYLAG